MKNTQGLNGIHCILGYMYIINEVPKKNAKRVKYIHAQHLTISRNNGDLAGARLTITLNEKRSGFFQYFSVDSE